MPSPFPGMNPYLEQSAFWSDFHGGYIHRCREVLAQQVLPRYFVRVDEHIYLHEMPEPRARLIGRPDISLTTNQPFESSGGTVTLEAPTILELIEDHDTETVPYLEVIDRASSRVVTVIELLSPSNKMRGPDREQYLAKRKLLTHAGVNYVELDFLRGGPRTLPTIPTCDYCIQVVKAPNWNRVGVWPLTLSDPLPVLPIPLRPGETEPTLDLQAILHDQYDAVGYGHFIYASEPEPTVAKEWMRS